MRKPTVAIDELRDTQQDEGDGAQNIYETADNSGVQQPMQQQQQQAPQMPQVTQPPQQANLLDLIIGGPTTSTSNPTSPNSGATSSGASSLLSLISGGAGASAGSPTNTSQSITGMDLMGAGSPFGRQDFKNGFVAVHHKSRPVEGGIECMFTTIPNGNVQIQLEFNVMPTHKLMTRPPAQAGSNTQQLIRIMGNTPYPLRIRVGWNDGQNVGSSIVVIDNAMI
eukprot:gnl/Chilomastix_caulleri/651.p1 GENE.gnl/Chilomastix_caulleri/651~~gnl/Chilomastix_caulleri/651.p1  ORF type:complete len:224 (+),score=73.38 gnl/Chilomastix_caulleri/651:59-730(+)